MRSKFHFTALWHELSHAVYAGEPQADAMAAIITRQSIAGGATVRFFADYRAYTSFAYYDNNAVRPHTNWHIVDASDYIGSLPQATIDALDEDQIKAIRSLKFGESHKASMRTFSALHKKFTAATGHPIREASFEALAAVSEDLLHSWRGRKGRADYAVLQRFHLAVARLGDMHQAYNTAGQDEGMDAGEQAMWSHGYRFHFMPPALPECLPPP